MTTEFPCCSPRKEEQHGEENSQRNYDQWNKTMDQRQHRTRICRKACGSAGGQHHSRHAVCSAETQFPHLCKKWFEVFSKPSVAKVTAITYERQLTRYIYPVLADIDIEDIIPADVQRIFNEMNGARETKIKVKNVLNMIFEQAVEDDLIRKNPLRSRGIRITGRASRPIEPYSESK